MIDVLFRGKHIVGGIVFHKHIFSSPEQHSRRAIVLPPASALALALALAFALASASTNVKVLR